MKLSDEEKADLHYALDYLLIAREGLERINPKELQEKQYYLAWSKPRHELLYNASKFLRRLVGEELHGEEHKLVLMTRLVEDTKDPENLATLANAIRPFVPLFAPLVGGTHQREFIQGMLEDLMGIYWGDEPRYFSILPKRQGLHKRPYRLATLRRGALDWEKHLEAAGLSAFERQRLVSDAYRTSWDAIRKWKNSIEEFDLYSWPPRRPDWVREEYNQDPARVLARIESDGAEYWREKSSAKAGKDL